jgi:hypothetical protein
MIVDLDLNPYSLSILRLIIYSTLEDPSKKKAAPGREAEMVERWWRDIIPR